jgi:hypothetical protein
MTIIKNHIEVFILTSKKARKWHYRVKSWVIFNKGQFTHICQLNVSYGQDSVFGIVHLLKIGKFSALDFYDVQSLTKIK